MSTELRARVPADVLRCALSGFLGLDQLKYLLTTSCVPGPVLDARDHSGGRKQATPCLHLVYGLQGEGLPWWFRGKESACQCRRRRFSFWVSKIPWRKKWQPSPVFLPGKSHGQRSLAGCSAWGHKRVGHDLATKQPQQLLRKTGLNQAMP